MFQDNHLDGRLKQMNWAIFSYLNCSENRIYNNSPEETAKYHRGHAPTIRWDSRELRSKNWTEIASYRYEPNKVLNASVSQRNTAAPS